MTQTMRTDEIGHAPHWHVVVASGELDLATAPWLEDAIERVTCGHLHGRIVLDLRGITFTDCAGLHPLLHARNRFKDALSLQVSPQVARLLDLAHLTTTFTLIADDEVAGCSCHNTLPCDVPRTPARLWASAARRHTVCARRRLRRAPLDGARLTTAVGAVPDPASLALGSCTCGRLEPAAC